MDSGKNICNIKRINIFRKFEVGNYSYNKQDVEDYVFDDFKSNLKCDICLFCVV